MKAKFHKAAKELGVEILSYESYRYSGCQCYDIETTHPTHWSKTSHLAIALGYTEEEKNQLVSVFKAELI